MLEMIKIFITFVLLISLGGCNANDKKSKMSNKAYHLSSKKSKSVNYNKSKINPNKFEISLTNDKRCFLSNGIPDHKTGLFPNKGNPNTISLQQINVCIPRYPKKLSNYTKINGIIGIALNGILFRPETAGFWDPKAPKKHSRNGDKNWSVDIFGVKGKLGLDFNNAHVGRAGMYHYHGLPTGLLNKLKDTHIGYAGDGFEIHYLQNKKKSGWSLKDGFRKSGPLGLHDGTYNEDYHYLGDGTELDECNGGIYNGKYVYFITDNYPRVPRCLYGKVSGDFNKSRH